MMGPTRGWAATRRRAAGLVLAMAGAALMATEAAAQNGSEVVVTLGGGMTFYAISTRVDTGTIGRGSIGYSPIPPLLFEVGVRRHGCFDCHSFSIVEGAVQVRRPGGGLSPFASIGGGWSSDPEFMGSEWGLLAAVGTWFWFPSDWGLQLEARGRQVGRGAHMGEFSVGVARRLPRREG